MKNTVSFICILLISLQVIAQGTSNTDVIETNHLNVFYDCDDCDVTFMKQNLNHVEFVRDQNFSDVHLLINSQANGSGGSSVMLQFIGQQEFVKLSDTLKFSPCRWHRLQRASRCH